MICHGAYLTSLQYWPFVRELLNIFYSQRASDAELKCCLWCQLDQMVEQTVELSLTWDPMTLKWHHCIGRLDLAYSSPWQHWKRLFVSSWEYTEPCLSLCGNAWERMAYRAIEIRWPTASNCVEMRGTEASNYMEMRGTASRKCVEMLGTAACVGMPVAWTPPNRGSRARDASGKRAGSTAQVRLKRVEPRWVPYLYRVKIRIKIKHFTYVLYLVPDTFVSYVKWLTQHGEVESCDIMLDLDLGTTVNVSFMLLHIVRSILISLCH